MNCNATFEYGTFGNKFALSNTADEVILRSMDNIMLDGFDYTEGFSDEEAGGRCQLRDTSGKR